MRLTSRFPFIARSYSRRTVNLEGNPGEGYDREGYRRRLNRDMAAPRVDPAIQSVRQTIHAFVNGRGGIRPIFAGTDTQEKQMWLQRWNEFKPGGPDSMLKIPDLMRISCYQLVQYNEITLRVTRQEGGDYDGRITSLCPLRPPWDIILDEATGSPSSFVWNADRRLPNRSLDASECVFFSIQSEPEYLRDFSLQELYPLMFDRYILLRRIVGVLKMLSRFLPRYKNKGGSPVINTQMVSADQRPPSVRSSVETDEDGWIELPADSELELGELPIFDLAPIDRQVSIQIANVLGLTPQMLVRNFEGMSFSAARFARVLDDETFLIYQQKLYEIASGPIFEAFEAEYGEVPVEAWHQPAFPSSEPLRDAMWGERLLKNRLASHSYVMRALGIDPDTEIDAIQNDPLGGPDEREETPSPQSQT